MTEGRSRLVVVALFLTTSLFGPSAFGQTPGPRATPVQRPAPRPTAARPRFPIARGHALVGVAMQSAPPPFSQSRTTTVNAEPASLGTSYATDASPSFAAGGDLTVWRRLGVGIAFARTSAPTATTVTGSVPHPFFFSRPRTFSADIAGLMRIETGVHVHARWTAPITRTLDVSVFGGPSFFQLKQGFVEATTYTETYPYDTIEWRASQTSTRSGSLTSVHAGADLAYYLAPRIGIGVAVLVTGGEVTLGDTTVTVGKPQAHVGLRIRF